MQTFSPSEPYIRTLSFLDKEHSLYFLYTHMQFSYCSRHVQIDNELYIPRQNVSKFLQRQGESSLIYSTKEILCHARLAQTAFTETTRPLKALKSICNIPLSNKIYLTLTERRVYTKMESDQLNTVDQISCKPANRIGKETSTLNCRDID